MENKAGLRRIYRKSWPYDNLFGTLRHELDAAQRGVWNDLLDMAKLGRVRPGLIAPGPNNCYKHEWLAAFLNIPFDLLNETLEKLKATNRIAENNNGIEIINWKVYQSEYDRQKPYRQSKQRREPTKAELDGNRYRGILNRKFKEFRKEEGREPTLSEEQVLRTSADREFEGKGGTK